MYNIFNMVVEEHKIYKEYFDDSGGTLPNFLYHATYRPLLRKIKKMGLDNRNTRRNWEDSIDGIVYLALTPDIAESYAESSEVVPDDWLDEIVILKIDVSKLDANKIFKDRNVRNTDNTTFEYSGVIPPTAIIF
jgi:hypothetical protein